MVETVPHRKEVAAANILVSISSRKKQSSHDDLSKNFSDSFFYSCKSILMFDLVTCVLVNLGTDY